MIKHFISVCCVILTAISTPVLAEDASNYVTREQFKTVQAQTISDVDKLEGKLDKAIGEIKDRFISIEQRLREIELLVPRIQQVEESVQGLRDINKEFGQIVGQISTFTSQLGEMQSRIATAETNALNASNETKNFRNTFTIVTGLVSVLVILVGLFFSQRFMTLYADAKVARELLSRIETQLISNTIARPDDTIKPDDQSS